MKTLALLTTLALTTLLPAQVGIIRAGCPSFPGFSGTGGGQPRIGNGNFVISPLPPCKSSEVSLDVLGVLPTTPLPIPTPLACEAGCTLVGPQLVLLVNAGRLIRLPIPNDRTLIGQQFWYQHGCQRPNDPKHPWCVVFNGGLSIKIMP